MNKVFGLIGKNLEHSFSKNYFEEKFKKQKLTYYKYINIAIEDIHNINNYEFFLHLINYKKEKKLNCVLTSNKSKTSLWRWC